MAETFGKMDKGLTEHHQAGDYIYGCKYQSGSAGLLASISVYLKYSAAGGTTKIKCAIYDSSLNLLTNGTTEEKSMPVDYDNWMVFDFPVSPSVAASTNYWLCWWFQSNAYTYYSSGSTDQRFYDLKLYNTWRDPVEPDAYSDRAYSIYATYEEVPPTKKTLVQAALISIPPLVVLPTVGQILKVTGGC